MARRRDGGSSCTVPWPSCPVGAGGIKVPTHPSAAGGWDLLVACCSFSLERIHLLAWCASELLIKIRFLNWTQKLNFPFSFLFFSQVKNRVRGDGEEKQMIWVYQKLHFDNLEEFCVDVFAFTYYYSNLAVNMKSNFDFPPEHFI